MIIQLKSVNNLLEISWEEGEVQSGFVGDMIFKRGIGMTTGALDALGFDSRNSLERFLDSWSAVMFDVPGIWEVVTLMSK